MPGDDATGWRRLRSWWENRPIGLQVGVVAPISIVALTVLHVTLLNQPMGRGTSYGVFWGILVTLLIVGGTRMERGRREAERERLHPDGDERRLRL